MIKKPVGTLLPSTTTVLGGVKIGSGVSVTADGTISVAVTGGVSASNETLIKRQNDGGRIFEFDFNSMTVEPAPQYLDIPVEGITGNRHVVHPHVIFFEDKWNGYQYWMVINPYPTSNANYENPFIMVSTDGLNWIQPPGITNPILPRPSIGYGSDVHLVRDIDGKTLHCLTREVQSGTGATIRRIRVLSSTNGINWTDNGIILESTVYDFVSPTVLYENGKYRMIARDIRTGQPNRLEIYESTSMLTPFTFVGTTSIPSDTVPTGRELWHLEIRKIDGLYVMIYPETNSASSGQSGKLKMAKSRDLLSWEVDKNYLVPNNVTWALEHYKSSFLLAEKDGRRYFKLWYGCVKNNSEWYVAYTEIDIGGLDKKAYKNSLEVKDFKEFSIADPKIIFYDDFNRVDSATIGVPKIGTWLSGDTAYAIQNNALKSVGVGTTELFTKVNVNNYEVRYHIQDTPSSKNLFFTAKKTNGIYDRFTFAAKWDTNGYNCGVVNSLGGLSEQVKFDWGVRNGDVIEVIFYGTQAHILKNGIYKYTHTITAGLTSQEIGIQTAGADTYIDKWVVRSL